MSERDTDDEPSYLGLLSLFIPIGAYLGARAGTKSKTSDTEWANPDLKESIEQLQETLDDAQDQGQETIDITETGQEDTEAAIQAAILADWEGVWNSLLKIKTDWYDAQISALKEAALVSQAQAQACDVAIAAAEADYNTKWWKYRSTLTTDFFGLVSTTDMSERPRAFGSVWDLERDTLAKGAYSFAESGFIGWPPMQVWDLGGGSRKVFGPTKLTVFVSIEKIYDRVEFHGWLMAPKPYMDGFLGGLHEKLRSAWNLMISEQNAQAAKKPGFIAQRDADTNRAAALTNERATFVAGTNPQIGTLQQAYIDARKSGLSSADAMKSVRTQYGI